MTRVLIPGATGRIGGLALSIALGRKSEVTALVRDPDKLTAHDSLRVVHGDVCDATVMADAMAGVDAVISALGPRANTEDAAAAIEAGMWVTVQAMADAGVHRIVTLSGAAVDVPGDQKPFLDRAMSGIAGRFARHVVGSKQREYEVLAMSDRDWTALRPPLVIDGAETGYVLAERLRAGARVTRTAIATALVDQVTEATFVRRAPYVLPKRSASAPR